MFETQTHSSVSSGTAPEQDANVVADSKFTALAEQALIAQAVVLQNPGELDLQTVELVPPGPGDVVVETLWSSISSGTERLLYQGKMPPFPGMGYPLIPGYESVGDVIWAGPESGREAGERVFVAGASCYKDAHALFGGAAARLITGGDRVLPVKSALRADAVLLALAATAQHILRLAPAPDLIVGHGVLGRLLARLAVLNSPNKKLAVWEIDAARRTGAAGYTVCDPQDDDRHDYRVAIDVSGDSQILDQLVSRLARSGEIVLGGFYSDRVGFNFPPAFMREVRIQIAAEFTPEDLIEVGKLCDSDALDLSGLITHHYGASKACEAYEHAFADPECLKMVLDWDETL